MVARRFSILLIMAAAWVPGLATAQSSVREFTLGNGATVISEDCIRLTPDAPWASGSAWFKRPIDLKRAFEMNLSIVLGKKDRDGADGIVFVFHPEMSTGFQGEGMGFAGLSPSLGIEFDTYQNLHLNDPAADHLALMMNGQRFHGEGGVGTIALPNLEDGVRHPLSITWNPQVGQLRIVLDGQLKASFRADVINSIFGGRSTVYWGMTAATGRLSNVQDVCIENLFIGA